LSNEATVLWLSLHWFPYCGFRSSSVVSTIKVVLFVDNESEERMRKLFADRIKNLFEERIRSLCSKAGAAKEPELESVLSELRATLHEHARFLQYVILRATRDVAEKTSSSDAA